MDDEVVAGEVAHPPVVAVEVGGGDRDELALDSGPGEHVGAGDQGTVLRGDRAGDDNGHVGAGVGSARELDRRSLVPQSELGGEIVQCGHAGTVERGPDTSLTPSVAPTLRM